MPSPLDRILKDLHNDEQKVRDGAKSDLARLRLNSDELTAAQGLQALRAAAQPYPFDKPTGEEVSENLVHVAADSPRLEYVPVVVELFDKFSNRGKWWALAILADLEECEAAVAYMEIVRRHARAGRIPRLLTGPLENSPRHADVFFPELLRYADIASLSSDVYRLCLVYCEAELLSRKTLAPFADQVLDAYHVLGEKLRPAQRDKGVAWMWEEHYTEWRFDAGLLLDLLGYFPADSVEADLRQALDYRDPRLQYFAITSLLRLGKPVDAKHVADVAAYAEMRNFLYNRLNKHDLRALYPEKYRTQAAFAEAEMVGWLTYPDRTGSRTGRDRTDESRSGRYGSAGRDL